MSDENWCTFTRENENAFVLISVNMALANTAPISDQPICTRLLFDLPRVDDGGSVDWDMLDAIDDGLQCVDAIEAGRTTCADGREYYFYGDDGPSAESELRRVMESFPDRRCSVQSERDKDWFLWATNLRPTRSETRRINDDLVVRSVADSGDDGSAVRSVRHWSYFDEMETAGRFADEAERAGFEVVANDFVDESGDRPAERVVILDKSQAIAGGMITETTSWLTRLAERFSGRYDGWETEVVETPKS